MLLHRDPNNTLPLTLHGDMNISSTGAQNAREYVVLRYRMLPSGTGTAVRMQTLPRASGFTDEGSIQRSEQQFLNYSLETAESQVGTAAMLFHGRPGRREAPHCVRQEAEDKVSSIPATNRPIAFLRK
jgi:hypothetical protein